MFEGWFLCCLLYYGEMESLGYGKTVSTVGSAWRMAHVRRSRQAGFPSCFPLSVTPPPLDAQPIRAPLHIEDPENGRCPFGALKRLAIISFPQMSDLSCSEARGLSPHLDVDLQRGEASDRASVNCIGVPLEKTMALVNEINPGKTSAIYSQSIYPKKDTHGHCLLAS